jgi:tetratricopeptide (TPR) repeat protein
VALPYFTALIEADSTNWDAYLRRAEVEHAINQRNDATVDYTKAIQFNPREAFLFLRRGRHYGTLHDCRNEIADFERGVALVPTSRPEGYNLAAELYSLESGVYAGCPDSALRDPHQAIETIQHAIALDSTRPIFFVNLAAAYASAGDLGAAITAQQRALDSPNAAPSYRDEWRRQLATYERQLSNKPAKPPRE